MGLKKGYKQTEVGLIPEDWEVTSAANACERIQDGTHFSPRLGGNDYLYVTSKNIRFGYLDLSTASRISSAEHQSIYRRCDVRNGDLLLTKDGANTGNAALNTLDEEFSLLSSVAFLRFQPREHCAAYFLQQILTSHGQRMIQDAMAGNAITRLTLQKIRKLIFPVPSTKAEQEAIAEALSDADALIESLEQLLAKKRHLKQGAMQDLLTGKRRLPGFLSKPGYTQTEVGVIPMDWEVRLLPDVCRFRGGKAHEKFVSDLGEYICVNSKFISTEGKARKNSTENFCRAKKGDVLMVMSDLPNGKALAKAYLVEQDDLYAVNQRVCALTSYHDCPEFLFYILNRNPYFLKFDDGVNQTHLLNPVFRKCPLLLPAKRSEQEAIAVALSDVDAEITALEAKLTKARQLKQGMMQELLTGRIRLVEWER